MLQYYIIVRVFSFVRNSRELQGKKPREIRQIAQSDNAEEVNRGRHSVGTYTKKGKSAEYQRQKLIHKSLSVHFFSEILSIVEERGPHFSCRKGTDSCLSLQTKPKYRTIIKHFYRDFVQPT